MKTNNQRKKGRWWKIPLVILLLIIVVAGGYVAYVFLSYDRIEDNKDLEVKGDAGEKAVTDKEYTIVSYNIGFGAYTADFTFFMDGGKESRARSKDSVVKRISSCFRRWISIRPAATMWIRRFRLLICSKPKGVLTVSLPRITIPLI